MRKGGHRFAAQGLRWMAAWSLLVISSATDNSTAFEPAQNGTVTHTGYAWSKWASWSPCSRTCGGGVSVQKRSCLPSPGITPESSPPTSRSAGAAAECSGSSQRYHECNTAPCSGEQKDLRSEQCSSFDRRPFRGRYYNWIPYVDGDSPCTLNCRPLGQQFYASLGLAADGTPCTTPGVRSICLQGVCKPGRNCYE